MAASPASRVVSYEFGHIDIVCTRSSNLGTSKSTHTYALVHTCFLPDLWDGGRLYQKNRANGLSTTGKIVPVVKLRHAKVVNGIYVRNQWHAFVPVSHGQVVIFNLCYMRVPPLFCLCYFFLGYSSAPE